MSENIKVLGFTPLFCDYILKNNKILATFVEFEIVLLDLEVKK